jgi:hypothetical protein
MPDATGRGDLKLRSQISTAAEPGSLPSYIPFQKTQISVREMNKVRTGAELAVTRMSFILGIIPALVCFIFGVTSAPGFAIAGLVGGWASGAFLTYVLSLLVLNWRCPWKKLVLSAEFDGILPTEVREKAHTAKSHFDNLYLVVDQQHRWKSTLLPDPRPRPLDPLLVAELKQGSRRTFFLIDQFDLTGAEQYLADEFATKRNETSGFSKNSLPFG